MVEFLAMINDMTFSLYPEGIKLDQSRQPKNGIKDSMSQPPTIKI